MPYSNLILTAGISALAPRNRLGERFREEGSPLDFLKNAQNPVASDSGWSMESVVTECRAFAEPITNFPEKLDPGRISAEFSMLHAIATHGQRLSPGAVVHLVHTPTLGGRLAVILQRPLLEARLGVQVHAHELSVPFDPAQAGGLALASGAFIGLISTLLRDCDPNHTAFAPIGGYKSMVALGHTAASFHGFHSLYLHEDSQVLQEIAPTPIQIPDETRAAISPLSRRVGNGAEWSSLSEAEQDVIHAHSAFFTRIGDLVELNELGQFLRLDEIPVRLSPEALDELNKDRALITKQLLQLRTLTVVNPDHPGVNHDWVGVKGRHHPWRIAKMGDGNRYAWQMDKDKLSISRIWRIHSDYENEAKSAKVAIVSEKDRASWSLMSD
ncbi:hypothetical protein N9F36_07695 [Akkermansiaceae bacterium]|nr:hypothetical protein [Akkermansiaceae bacterium]